MGCDYGGFNPGTAPDAFRRKPVQYDVGVVVGRFQVPEFHAGHKHLLDAVYRSHHAMLVFLGTSSINGTIEDPLDFSIRQQMIADLYPNASTLAILDREDDDDWSRELDTMVKALFPNRTVCLYGSRDSFLSHYKGEFATAEIEPLQSVSGTEIRDGVEAKNHTVDFRRGMIYALRYQWPAVKPTVDVALVDQVLEQVLMGRKSRGPQGLVFPGGFVQPSDESYEAAAVRELREETGMVLAAGVAGLRYIGSFRVDDWRYRNRRDKILTTLYLGNYLSGKPKAADDLQAVEWLRLKTNNLVHVADHHKPLFERLMEYA